MTNALASGLFGLGGLGTTFTEARKLAVWAKGEIIQGFDPAVWRRDAFGSVMRYGDYGDRNLTNGWEIDHIHPSALLGSDDISNLRPLNCTNNAGLGGLLSGIFKR
jgi:hypothetical protein